jgi:hypothetical protein
MNFLRTSAALALGAAALLLTSTPARAAEPPAEETPRVWRFGAEIDALPYATGGYYGSFVAARREWRVRAVAARSTMPGFLVEDGFEDKRTDAYALLVDRFLGARRSRQEGFWVGGGVELWSTRIRPEGGNAYTRYNNLMLTAGAGYVWKFSRHFYLNPWAGVHFAAAGERVHNVSGRVYEQARFTPEASIKLGYTF